MTIIKTIKNSFLRPLLLNFKRIKGKHYNKKGSTHIKFLDNEKILLPKLVNKYLNKEMKILNIGAGSKKNYVSDLCTEKNYFICDVAPNSKKLTNYVKSDICQKTPFSNNYFDLIYSHSTFEHLHNPFAAASEIVRILKPGGLVFTNTVFSWRYHPCSEDYFRFTHSGLENIFSKHEKLTTLLSGYDISGRRVNVLGGKMINGTDSVKEDILGGWLENWVVMHVGKKLN
jgi:SAM-dependent methyltransferase